MINSSSVTFSFNHASHAPMRPTQSIRFNCQGSTITDRMDCDSDIPQNSCQSSYSRNTNFFQNQMIQRATNLTGPSPLLPKPSACRSIFGDNAKPLVPFASPQTKVADQNKIAANLSTNSASTANAGVPNYLTQKTSACRSIFGDNAKPLVPFTSSQIKGNAGTSNQPTQNPTLQFRQQSSVPMATAFSASSHNIPVNKCTFEVFTDLEPMDTDENANLAEEDFMELDESVCASMDYE